MGGPEIIDKSREILCTEFLSAKVICSFNNLKCVDSSIALELSSFIHFFREFTSLTFLEIIIEIRLLSIEKFERENGLGDKK